MFALNTYNLKVFRLCVEVRNFTEVANALSISQPAVSRHIHDIEQYFGVPVFSKSKGRLILTEAGEKVYLYAVNQLNSLDTLKLELSSFGQGLDGQIVVGASPVIGEYRLTEILGEFMRRYAQVNLRLVIDNEALLMVQDGSIDFACILSDGACSGLAVEPLYYEPQILVASPSHPLARQDVVNVDQLSSYPIIISLNESHYVKKLKRALADAGIKNFKVIQLGNTGGVKRGIQCGLGIGFVCKSAVEVELNSHDLKEIKVRGLDISIRVDLVHRPDRNLLPVTSQLYDEIKGRLQVTQAV